MNVYGRLEENAKRLVVMTISTHIYEVRPRRDKRGVDLISDVLPFGRLWYGEPNAVSNALATQSFTAVHTML
jgi:hypothetical protein